MKYLLLLAIGLTSCAGLKGLKTECPKRDCFTITIAEPKGNSFTLYVDTTDSKIIDKLKALAK